MEAEKQPMIREFSRREMIAMLGGAAAVSLAGCDLQSMTPYQ